MAIGLIDVVTPTVGLKAGADILNLNFTDTTNAAAVLVQTSATDATAGRALITDKAGAATSPLFNSNNLNIYEFEGNTSDLLTQGGFARTATTANIYLPASSFSDPVSITVTGSFTVDTYDFTSRGTITSTEMTLQGISTGRLTRIDITGLSGAVAGEDLILRSAAAGSKITVNY